MDDFSKTCAAAVEGLHDFCYTLERHGAEDIEANAARFLDAARRTVAMLPSNEEQATHQRHVGILLQAVQSLLAAWRQWQEAGNTYGTSLLHLQRILLTLSLDDATLAPHEYKT